MLNKIGEFLPGAKTYLGIIMAFVGTLASQLGWDWWALVSADIQDIVNQIITLAGLIIATVGRIVAKPKV
jgi:hypothetical protein